MCVLGRSPNNSLMVVFGDEVVLVAARNAIAMDDVATAIDVAATDGFAVAVGAVAAVVAWVQQCWMRACTNLQSHLVLAVGTLRGNKLSLWYWKTT